MEKINEKLSNIYYNVASSAGYSSAKKLAEASNVDIKLVKEWLSTQDAYTQHKPKLRNYKRNRYHTSTTNVYFEADLADMRSMSDMNKGVKFVLFVIDIFSKKAWAEPLKDKKSVSVAQALKMIFKRSGFPVKLRSDRGREFLGPEVRDLLKKHHITQIVTDNEETKCAVVERLLRTIKERLSRFFTHTGKRKYIHVLQDVMDAYNTSYHSAIGCKPSEVNSNNTREVYDYLYSGKGRYSKLETSAKVEPKLKVNDFVKISASKHKLQKGYDANWSYEVFKIAQIIKREPVVYKLVDWEGEPVTGVFYESELQKIAIKDSQTYRIERIISSSGSGKNKKLLVKWLGYPDKFNSYILEKDLHSYD
jgi:transposase InsO family protein